MKSEKLLREFSEFCAEHPELRFWQALRAWADVGFILKVDNADIVSGGFEGLQDTFYWEDKSS